MEKKDYDEICGILFDNNRQDLINKLNGTQGYSNVMELIELRKITCAVQNKYPNETRCETAIRYVKESENKSSLGAKQHEQQKTK